VQLALNVSDLEASVAFYSAMFGVEPHKRRPGYANFAITEPPLKLVLIETSEASRGTGTAGALNHLGVEVASTDAVAEARARFTDAGLAAFDENDTTCCYALQDKVWVHDPAGAPWEVYTVKDEDPAGARPATASLEILGDGACCTSATPPSATSPSATSSSATSNSAASGSAASDAATAPKAQACCS
jgi:catechol 2,3-dioxygenase-like lactoylglutathione lyase family enzyme